jgi:hypothetical protein
MKVLARFSEQLAGDISQNPQLAAVSLRQIIGMVALLGG